MHINKLCPRERTSEVVAKYPGQGAKVQNLRGVGGLELATLHSDAPGYDDLDSPRLLVLGAGVIGSGNAELI